MSVDKYEKAASEKKLKQDLKALNERLYDILLVRYGLINDLSTMERSQSEMLLARGDLEVPDIIQRSLSAPEITKND